MTNTPRLGIEAIWSLNNIAIGIGWSSFGQEKYLYINLFFLEVVMGKIST